MKAIDKLIAEIESDIVWHDDSVNKKSGSKESIAHIGASCALNQVVKRLKDIRNESN